LGRAVLISKPFDEDELADLLADAVKQSSRVIVLTPAE
jgi:hypothetical protein